MNLAQKVGVHQTGKTSESVPSPDSPLPPNRLELNKAKKKPAVTLLMEN